MTARNLRYQQQVNGIETARGVPDITINAGGHPGAMVAWGSSGEPEFEFWTFWGTSAGTPEWAGLVAIADQIAHRRLGNVNPTLYALGKGSQASRYFRDITQGSNEFAGVRGYPAASGWDAASGWGSPLAGPLARALAASTAESGDQTGAAGIVRPPALASPQTARERHRRPLP
jgi:subtilase family serine protease